MASSPAKQPGDTSASNSTDLCNEKGTRIRTARSPNLEMHLTGGVVLARSERGIKTLQSWAKTAKEGTGRLESRGQIDAISRKGMHARQPKYQKGLSQTASQFVGSRAPWDLQNHGVDLKNYWWPEMTKYIKHYMETCDTCNRKKNWSQKPKGEL